MDSQIAAIALIAILAIAANVAVFLSGIYVDDSKEKFEKYAFNVSEPSLKFITSTFVHKDLNHITENLIGFGFGVAVFILFANRIKKPFCSPFSFYSEFSRSN